MNKTTIIGITIAILILAAIIWIARPTSQNDSAISPASISNGTLVAEEVSFDFGAISMATGEVEHSFKIKNASAKPIIIEKIYTSCMCTTATLVKNDKKFGPYGMPGHGFIPKINEPINPNEEATIEIVFDPAAHGPAGIGPTIRLVYIENSGETLELKISANVTP